MKQRWNFLIPWELSIFTRAFLARFGSTKTTMEEDYNRIACSSEYDVGNDDTTHARTQYTCETCVYFERSPVISSYAIHFYVGIGIV